MRGEGWGVWGVGGWGEGSVVPAWLLAVSSCWLPSSGVRLLCFSEHRLVSWGDPVWHRTAYVW